MNKLMVIVGVVALFVTMEVSLGAELGAECSEDDDCTGDNIVCRIYHMCGNGTCECGMGYKEVESACKAVKHEGDSCTADTDVCEPDHEGVTCQGETPTCSCGDGKTWVGGMCVTTADYIALGQACTTENAANCYGHFGQGGDAIYQCTGDDGSMMCACTDNYMEDTDNTGICIKKKAYNDACTPGTDDAQCPDAFPCRALTEGGDNKCNCPAPAEGASEMNYNSRTNTCVNTEVGIAKGQPCAGNDDTVCADMLHCAVCPRMTDKKCRDVKSGGGSSSSEDTSGAAHLAAGVATIILSAVAMFL